MSLIDKIYIKLFYQKVGTDQFGNNYYQTKLKDNFNRCKRYVIYQGQEDGSKIPPIWHAWLHHINDEAITDTSQQYDWQLPHTPNMTGTNLAYKPNRPIKTEIAAYQSWKPTRKLN